MGSLHIRNDHAASSTILVTGGSLSLSDVRIDRGSPEVGAIVLRGGRAQIDGSTIATSGGAPLLRADGGELSVTDSTLVGGTTPSEESLVVLSGGASADLLHTKLESGSALRIAAVRADHATLSIEGGELSSGIATASAVGLLSQSSSVSLKDTAIRSSSDSRLTFGIQAVGSKLTVDGVTIDARGQVGATGVYADNSTVSINAATIRGAQTSEFLYLVKLVGSQAALTNSLLTGARSGDFLAVGLTRSTGYVVDNTLFGGEGRDRLAALLLESSPGVNVADNIFARVPTSAAGQQPGVAILVRASTFVGAILSNDFSGYAAVYEDGAGKRADVGALDRSDGNEKGGSFAGNVTEAPIATFAAAGDFHLTPGSLCRGSGVDPARFGAPATDIEGTKRSGRFDIGAYFGR